MRIDSFNPHVFHVGDNRHEPVSLVAPHHGMYMRDPEHRKAEYNHPKVKAQDRLRIRLKSLPTDASYWIKNAGTRLKRSV